MSESDTIEDSARRRAFREVVEPEIEVMLRVARGLTGNAADAEDLVQESRVRAFKAIDRFDGRYPRAWLLRSCATPTPTCTVANGRSPSMTGS